MSQYGDLSNDEDDDLYPPQISVVEFMNRYCTHVCRVKDVVKLVQE